MGQVGNKESQRLDFQKQLILAAPCTPYLTQLQIKIGDRQSSAGETGDQCGKQFDEIPIDFYIPSQVVF